MKKNKITKILLIILISILLCLVLIYFLTPKHLSKKYNPIKEENIIEEILKDNQEEKITKLFFMWLEKESGKKKLTELKEELNNKVKVDWHQI